MIPRRIRARAPLRLGFAGGGTDVSPYCDEFGGVSFNATIDLFAHVTLESRADGQVELSAEDRQETWSGKAQAELPTVEPLRLLKGVYNRCIREFFGGRPQAVTLTSYADCPPGSGLGTSSALVVAMVRAFAELADVTLSPARLARLAFEIERVDLGLAGGRQDQYAAAFGGFNFMQFLTDDSVVIEPVDVAPDVLRELEASLVLYFTGVSRESATIIEQQASNMRRHDARSLDGLHALKAAGYEMRDALAAGDLQSFGALLNAGWEAKKKTADRISSGAIDEVMRAAESYGVWGAKVSGAGGGGFIMFLVEATRREGLKRFLAQHGGEVMGAKFIASGVESWRAQARLAA
jgi:D-glycero-alpha-D-manno-heptose-7-phosphate kinase